MNESWLEIREYTEAGYRPQVDYGTWRVAVLNYIDELEPAHITRFERHMQTDEVFVLTRGQGVLMLAGNDAQAGVIVPQVMQPGKIYNVKRGAWHGVLLTLDASVLLVENRDTGINNSEYCNLTPEQRSQIVQLAQDQGIG